MKPHVLVAAPNPFGDAAAPPWESEFHLRTQSGHLASFSNLVRLFNPVGASKAPLGNLPLQLTSFVGRERETAEVSRLLRTTRLLTLIGTGGCGKTRLSLQLGADLLDAYPDGVWLVELAPLTDPSLVPQAIGRMLRVLRPVADRARRLRKRQLFGRIGLNPFRHGLDLRNQHLRPHRHALGTLPPGRPGQTTQLAHHHCRRHTGRASPGQGEDHPGSLRG